MFLACSDSDKLEGEDHIATDSGLARSSVFVETESFSVPNPTNFWSEGQIRIGFVVDASREIEVVVVSSVGCVLVDIAERLSVEVEPLESLSERNAIVHLVDQVIDISEGVALDSARTVSRVQHVGLRDVSQLVAEGCRQDEVMDTTSFVGRIIGSESTLYSGVQESEGVVDLLLETADVSVAVIFEAAVPTHDITVVQLGVGVHIVRGQSTRVSERFSVVESELTAVEKVASRLNHFITDDGIEVTELNTQIAHGYFAVNLWQGMAILAAVVPAVVPVIVRNAERLRVLTVGTVDIIDSSTETEAFATVSNLLSEEILLT